MGKSKCLILCLVSGMVFTALTVMSQLFIAGQRPNFNTMFVVLTAMLWPTYSFTLWVGCFSEPLNLSRLSKSFGCGLAFTVVCIAMLFFAGKAGDTSPYGIAPLNLSHLNVAGVIFYWILVSGLFFSGFFGPKSPQAVSAKQ